MENTPETVAASSRATELRLLRKPAEILLAGVGLGVAADYLLWYGPLGPGFAVWLTLLGGATLWLARGAGRLRLRTIGSSTATAVLAAVLLLLRDVVLLYPALWLVVLTATIPVLLQADGLALRTSHVADHLLALFMLPLRTIGGTARLLARIDLSVAIRNPHLPGLLRGLVLALPPLLIFGLLFASADAAFSRYAARLTDLISPLTLQHLMMIGGFGWISAGLLSLSSRKTPAPISKPPRVISLGTEETAVILGLTLVLFLFFVGLQLAYLFGGAAFIENSSGLTLAEYARRGFFELLLVSLLTLGLLLGASATRCERRVFMTLGALLVACVLVILASAAQRLVLYTGAFGLTIDRFSALAFMGWQTLNLLSFTVTVLRGRGEWFASCLTLSGMFFVLLLGFVNPAMVVAKINIDRALDEGKALDAEYLLQLGADAVPVLLERLDEFPVAQQCQVAQHLDNYWSGAAFARRSNGRGDWRTWNLARATAIKRVDANLVELRRIRGNPANNCLL